MQAVDIQDVYDAFLYTVRMLIAKTVPCHYWTEILHLSLVKTLLSKRRRLRKSGRIDEDVLAEIINLIISETRSKQLAKLSDASPKQLWRASKTSASEARLASYPNDDIESVNAYFADVCTDLGYSKADVCIILGSLLLTMALPASI